MRIIALVILLIATASVPGNATLRPCAETGISIVTTQDGVFEQLCTATRDTVDFLQTIGLNRPEGLSIVITDELPHDNDHRALAQYDCRTHTVGLLYYAVAVKAIGAAPLPFGVPMTPALWRSYAAHEIAHAAVHRHLHCELRSLAATEYIAAVVQLATLPAVERDRILSNYPQLGGFDSPREITEIYYKMAPCQFAVQAWLHFVKPGNGPKFIAALLTLDSPLANAPSDQQ